MRCGGLVLVVESVWVCVCELDISSYGERSVMRFFAVWSWLWSRYVYAYMYVSWIYLAM